MLKKINTFFRENRLFGAIIHVAWIIIMSAVIVILADELFNNSNYSTSGNIIGIILIVGYVLFSFAKKYGSENNSKKVFEITDTTLTLLGGFSMIMISFGRTDNIGFTLKDLLVITGSQPPMYMFYLGVLLLIVGIIKVFIIHRNRINYFTPKI
jgi:hypothetical protein